MDGINILLLGVFLIAIAGALYTGKRIMKNAKNEDEEEK